MDSYRRSTVPFGKENEPQELPVNTYEDSPDHRLEPHSDISFLQQLPTPSAISDSPYRLPGPHPNISLPQQLPTPSATSDSAYHQSDPHPNILLPQKLPMPSGMPEEEYAEPPKISAHRSSLKKVAKNMPSKSRSRVKMRPAKSPPYNKGGRLYTCNFEPYGCTARFSGKRGWEGHVNSQHIQPGFYRCNVGRCKLIGGHDGRLILNDFNRKDLFMQHQRRMHAPWGFADKMPPADSEQKRKFESSLEDTCKRCWRQSRPLPTLTMCGFCGEEFHGFSAWKDHMEHLARHFEKSDPGPNLEDLHLRDWAVENGVILLRGDKYILASLCKDSDTTVVPSQKNRDVHTIHKESTESSMTNASRMLPPGEPKNTQLRVPTGSENESKFQFKSEAQYHQDQKDSRAEEEEEEEEEEEKEDAFVERLREKNLAWAVIREMFQQKFNKEVSEARLQMRQLRRHKQHLKKQSSSPMGSGSYSHLANKAGEHTKPGVMMPPIDIRPQRIRPGVFTNSAYGTATHIGPEPTIYQGGKSGAHVDNDNDYSAEESGTVYSGESTVSDSVIGDYISAFIEELLTKAFSGPNSRTLIAKIQDKIPDLLKNFADKIGYNTQSQSHLDMRFYILNNRRRIAARISDANLEPLSTTFNDGDKMSLHEKIHAWFQGLSPHACSRSSEERGKPEHYLMDEQTQDGEAEEQFDHSVHLNSKEYQKLITETPAYQWLVESVQKELNMDMLTSSPNNIASFVIDSFPRCSRISRKEGTEAVKLALTLAWHPISFFKAQEYMDAVGQTFDRIITLTGSLDDAQAMTCVDYMRQTWPSTGEPIVNVMKAALRAGRGKECSCTLPDDSHLIVRIDNSGVTVEAIGARVSVAEIAEQFAWLGSSVRESTSNIGVGLCRPYITGGGSTVDDTLSNEKVSASLHCHINFSIQEPRQRTQSGSPRCWHNIFRNPVVVEGYPIRLRPVPNTGLETCIDILSSLVSSRRVSRFGRKIYIKGFSTILVPTGMTQKTVIWHVIFNEDSSYISYVDSRIDALPGLYPERISDCNLLSFRHIIGWCPEVEMTTGSPLASYSIDWSDFENANKDCSLFDVSVSPGRFIKNQKLVAVGRKDKAIHLVAESYREQIRWIARRFVVLYDAQVECAWMVDGASALLHLVRASLHEDEADDIDDKFIYRSNHLKEAQSAISGRVAAHEVLMNPINKELQLFASEDQKFRHRVERIYHILEQLFAHQDELSRSLALQPTDPSRQFLEAFEFMDIATNQDHIRPRVHADQQYGPSWLALTKRIAAITLCGKGFGDLIVPKDDSKICTLWKRVPQGLNHLTVCTSDLRDIVRKRGSFNSSPWRILDDIYWSPLESSGYECDCNNLPQARCNLANILLPRNIVNVIKTGGRSPQNLPSNGAIIFSAQWGARMLHRKKDAYLQGVELSLSKGRESSFTDSGISLGSGLESHRDIMEGIGTVALKRQASDEAEAQSPAKRVYYGVSSSDIYSPNRALTNRLSPTQSTADYAGRSMIRGSGILNDHAGDGQGCGKPAAQMVSQEFLLSENNYTVGWICALPEELKAAQRILDKFHRRGYGQGTDNNLYILGQVGNLNIVITCLPLGQYGSNMATMVATRMLAKFPKIEIGLMVGIGGGLPSPKDDIRLGDVVVSKPHMQYGGVFQYDMGKFTSRGFVTTGCLKAPPEKLLSALNFMVTHGTALPHKLETPHPGPDRDYLYQTSYPHVGDKPSCESCDVEHLVRCRPPRSDTQPHVFYGTIASGNSVIKDSEIRDTLVKQHGVLCCEMEAAGLMNTGFPCLVIRGISDYADSHKNDVWVEYAAAAAAQYAKELLYSIPGALIFV